MEKTLVIILSETRAHELTFENIKEHLLDPLQADLCVCIGVRSDYDASNPFYTHAKYKFLYPEPNDYATAFDEAYKESGADGLPWREFLKIKDQFLGGIKDPENEHPGSAAILLFFRWFLRKNLETIWHYDRFIITRSDFIYQVPHAPMKYLDPKYIWIPDCEGYRGYTDRHAVLSKENIHMYLGILDSLFSRSHEYYEEMKLKDDWNLERLIKFHLDKNGGIVKEFPYVMYSVRSENGTTRWSPGEYSSQHGYYIKYPTEYEKSSYYRSIYSDQFYTRYFQRCR